MKHPIKKSTLTISEKEFTFLKNLLYTKTGIYLHESKKPMVVARLRKRLFEIGISHFSEYCKILNSSCSNREINIFINAITTNKTCFFRTPQQFEYLENEILPELIKKGLKTGEKNIIAWSAGCSTGEEAYSIAISIIEGLQNTTEKHENWNITVYATDINNDVITKAKAGIYNEESIVNIDHERLIKYFIPQKTQHGKNMYSVVPQLKNVVNFSTHNLKNPFFKTNIDFIFMRNVIIYFGNTIKQNVIENTVKSLKHGGYLFLGYSESLIGIHAKLESIKPSIYRKP